MADLARRVGLGLAARGDVKDTAEWARRAEDLGLDSVWVHDSYFERDPITYLTAIGQVTRHIGLGAGALNPYTRHPVVLAMTMSALDDLAPRRCTLAIGSGLPLRLSQVAIPYDGTVARVSESIDQIRTLWRGEPLKLNDKVPPLQPMFQPPHRIPIYIAAYRTAFLDLCAQKADGYLGRPAESLPAYQKMRGRVLERAAAQGRAAGEIDFRGYLLCLFDDSRREALNRAKREPFVIYMISVLSDISLKRAGFDPQLRTQIATAWRAEDYHRAGELIPDELLDAFILCGTVDEVAARANAYHDDAGLDVRHGIDSITSPRMSMAILKGRISERGAFLVAWSGFILALVMGIFLTLHRGWPIVLLGLVGFIGGYFYTAPPFQYKYRALGLPLVFVLMGPVMVGGAYYAVTGTFDANLLVVSLPVGLLVTAILHGNEWRDVA